MGIVRISDIAQTTFTYQSSYNPLSQSQLTVAISNYLQGRQLAFTKAVLSFITTESICSILICNKFHTIRYQDTHTHTHNHIVFNVVTLLY